MKFGVVVFPGSNCDRDMIHVLRNVMKQEVHEIWHKQTELTGFAKEDCILLPGGFSYGDYLRTGALARFSPIMQSVISHCKMGGKAFGICNGFQILCESGLLPGVLRQNNNRKYICKNVYLKVENNSTALTHAIPNYKILKIPIAHGDGNYFADPATLQMMNENKQILFRYCTANGVIDETANPNGACENIAGICNEAQNVFGMMPHPERAAENILGNDDGRLLFTSLVNEKILAA